jgi:hypothetical protein
LFTKISEFIFEKQQRYNDGSRFPPPEVQGYWSIETIKDGNVIRRGYKELFTDSNVNDLKGRVGTTMSEDICSHII